MVALRRYYQREFRLQLKIDGGFIIACPDDDALGKTGSFIPRSSQPEAAWSIVSKLNVKSGY